MNKEDAWEIVERVILKSEYDMYVEDILSCSDEKIEAVVDLDDEDARVVFILEHGEWTIDEIDKDYEM